MKTEEQKIEYLHKALNMIQESLDLAQGIPSVEVCEMERLADENDRLKRYIKEASQIMDTVRKEGLTPATTVSMKLFQLEAERDIL